MRSSTSTIARPDEIRAGVIVPADMALDAELWRWAPDGVSLLFTRTRHVDEDAVRQCVHDLSAAAPAAFACACTTDRLIDGLPGEKRLVEAMQSAGGGEAVTTSGAMLSALTHLGIRRLAMATPHDATAAEQLVSFLAEADVDVVGRARLEPTTDVWTVPYERTMQLVRDADADEAQAVLVSDTNIATYDVIAPLEAELRKPVLTANQVTMWALLGAIGREAVGPHQWLISGPRVGDSSG
jgi:maleate isomerase